MNEQNQLERHAAVLDYERFVNPAFVRLLGTFGYGRVFVRGRGTTLYDDRGREYLDMLAAFGAANLGHSHPELTESMISFLREEAVNLVHVGPQPHAAELARELATLVKSPLEVSLLSNSGGEAVESAMKLARAATGRSAIVHATGGFHGTGLGPLSILGHERMRAPFEPLVPDCHAVPFGDLELLEQALAARRVAAFVVEPVQAEGGVVIPPPDYLRGVRQLCSKHGALFVLDEVQTGLGRTGRMFAYEREGVVPDVLVLGKSLGGGMLPISAAITSRAIHQRAYGTQDKFDLHGTTYSGNAFACRVARDTLRITQREKLAEHAEELGAHWLSALQQGLAGHPLVREVRGQGLLIGIELGPHEPGLFKRLIAGAVEQLSEKVFGQWVALRLLERGIVCQPASQKWNVLRLEPPLIVTRSELDRTTSDIVSVLGEYKGVTALIKDVASRVGEQYRAGWVFR